MLSHAEPVAYEAAESSRRPEHPWPVRGPPPSAKPRPTVRGKPNTDFRSSQAADGSPLVWGSQRWSLVMISSPSAGGSVAEARDAAPIQGKARRWRHGVSGDPKAARRGGSWVVEQPTALGVVSSAAVAKRRAAEDRRFEW